MKSDVQLYDFNMPSAFLWGESRTSQPLKSVLILQIGKDVFIVINQLQLLSRIISWLTLYYIADRMASIEIKMD